MTLTFSVKQVWPPLKHLLIISAKCMLAIFVCMGVALPLAWLAICYPAQYQAFTSWMSETRQVWLFVRLGLYTLIALIALRIWGARGFKQEYRRPFIRILIAGTTFILLCEIALFRGHSL